MLLATPTCQDRDASGWRRRQSKDRLVQPTSAMSQQPQLRPSTAPRFVVKLRQALRSVGSVHSVRVEAEYDWPADQLLSVAREFDVVGSFNRFAQVSVFRTSCWAIAAGYWILHCVAARQADRVATAGLDASLHVLDSSCACE